MPPVVVFDLDGTILRVNSFPHWVRYLIAGRLSGAGVHRRLLLSLRGLGLLMRRKLLRASHDQFQWQLQQAWQGLAARRPVTLDRFETALLRHVRPNVAAMLELAAAQRIDALLATAAAADYAAGLGRRLGFRHVVATRPDRQRGSSCNVGAVKRDSVHALLDELGWRGRPIVLFTDHIDDLPLIRDSVLVCWFGTREAMAIAAAEAAGVRFAYCRDLDDAAVAACLSGRDAAVSL